MDDILILNNTVFYLTIAVGIILILTIIVGGLYFLKLQSKKKYYSRVIGRVILKGKVDYSDTRITIGRLKNKEKLAVAPLLDRDGNILRTTTDKRGNFSLDGVPSGVHWIIVEAKGYKTIIKNIKVERKEENKLADIIMKQ